MTKFELMNAAMVVTNLFKTKSIKEDVELTSLIELLIAREVTEEDVLNFIREKEIKLKI